jgi:ribosome-associated protein
MNPDSLNEEIRSKAEITFSRSSGPGGQNVNKRDTKVTVHIKIDSLETLNDTEINRIRRRLSRRISSDGFLVIQADGERSQARNKEEALERLETLILHGLRPDPKTRKKTKPSRAAKERRIMGKKKRSRVKKGRGKVSRDCEE